jgi:hypothetical protein
MMKLLKAPKKILKMGAHMLHDLNQIARMVANPALSQSYYPSEPRKSKAEVFIDLLVWWIRHREVNTYYYVYGLDRRHLANADQYLPYRTFRRIRNQRNQHPKGIKGWNYVCLLQDKFIFSQLLSSLGFPTPKNVALSDGHTITWLDSMQTVPLERLLDMPDVHLDLFCKPLMGIGGTGAFPLTLSSGKLFINREAIDVGQLKDRLSTQYLIQERLRQHPQLSALYPHAMNTIRLVTFNNDGQVQLFSAEQRFGAHGQSVDNWGAGGVGVAIDLITGRLRAEGLMKPGYGGRVLYHPNTRVPFADFQIPYFQEAVDLVCRLHRYFYGIHSIGWDICITEAGPLIIEGNDDWAMLMSIEERFKDKFLAMYKG